MSPDSLRMRLGEAARGAADGCRTGLGAPPDALARRARSGRPEVTVVVLARGKEEHVRASLDSVRDQPVARLEIVVVVMDERLQPLADRAAAEDWRVRTVKSYGSDWAMARQFGAVAARTGWLLFLSPRQLLLPGAVTALLEARGERRTVVVGQVEDGTSWARLPLLGRLLVPSELWGGALDDGEPDGQTVAVVLVADTYADTGHSYAEARVPVLRDTVERARLFERVENPAPQLSSRVAQDRSMIASLDRDELAEERSARATGALVRDLPRFVLGVEHYDEQQWGLLSRHVEEMVATAGDEGLAAVPVEDRVALWLAAAGRREELTAFVAARRFAGGEFATSVEGGRVRALLDAAPKDVPDTVLTLGDAETPAARAGATGSGRGRRAAPRAVRGRPPGGVRVPDGAAAAGRPAFARPARRGVLRPRRDPVDGRAAPATPRGCGAHADPARRDRLRGVAAGDRARRPRRTSHRDRLRRAAEHARRGAGPAVRARARVG